jgi:deazaflavin-dependent oxidoreductase (nitroreductase family)
MPLEGEYAPSTSGWARKQAEAFEASDGAEANTLRGRPIIVLTTVGSKSGKLRQTALMRVEHDGEYAVVGSQGGSHHDPKWVSNLRRHPHVELQDNAEKHDYTARELEGEERERWWRRANETWPSYDGYQEKTDRLIPVFLLTRIVL